MCWFGSDAVATVATREATARMDWGNSPGGCSSTSFGSKCIPVSSVIATEYEALFVERFSFLAEPERPSMAAVLVARVLSISRATVARVMDALKKASWIPRPPLEFRPRRRL
eukprot:4990226-Lingulodinium_polyedra.AAC.1